MTSTNPTDIIEISDSDNETRSFVQITKPIDSETPAAVSDSVLVIESSDSEAPNWSSSDHSDELIGIIDRLALNSQQNAFPTKASRTTNAPPKDSSAFSDDTISLTSSEDQSILATLSQAIKPNRDASDRFKGSTIPSATMHKPPIPKSRVLSPTTGSATKVKDLKKADAKLHREVNKLVTDRKSTIKDFTVEISSALEDWAFIEPFSERLAAYGGSVVFFEPPGGVEHLIRFRRGHVARYDASLKEWIPVDAYTRLEDLYVILLSADRLAQAVSEDTLSSMLSDLRNIHRLTNRSQIFLMVDGMNGYYKRKGGNKTKRDTIESSVTLLQAVEGCFIVHVDSPEDTTQWLFNITCDLGIRPHKRIQDSFLPFCTDTKVKCGTSKDDTYKKMLQQIHGITESAADGIIQEVPTLRMLFEGYSNEGDIRTRCARLKDVTISNRKDGVAKSRILNQALSKKVHDVIWGEDPLTLVL